MKHILCLGAFLTSFSFQAVQAADTLVTSCNVKDVNLQMRVLKNELDQYFSEITQNKKTELTRIQEPVTISAADIQGDEVLSEMAKFTGLQLTDIASATAYVLATDITYGNVLFILEFNGKNAAIIGKAAFIYNETAPFYHCK